MAEIHTDFYSHFFFKIYHVRVMVQSHVNEKKIVVRPAVSENSVCVCVRVCARTHLCARVYVFGGSKEIKIQL